MTDLDPPLTADELAEAAHAADPPAYARRQRRARRRVALHRAFYADHPGRTAALHELAASAIALARYGGLSETFDRIGDALMPVDHAGHPRTAAWAEYARSFDEARPADYREELWLAAHTADVEAVKEAGLVEAFHAERALHPGDPTWDLLAEHMEVALGTRVQDREALAGLVALETAAAAMLSGALRRLLGAGVALLRAYVGKAVRAVLFGGPRLPDGVRTDRQLVCGLVSSTLRVARVTRVWRLGVRRRSRGAERQGAAWSLLPSLERALGPALRDVHPTVAEFFDRLDRFALTASVHLHSRFGLVLAWVATLLVGQGMYEQHLDEVDARFRLFRRDDGSLHFVREFWCADAIRVFDSDFVVRDVDGVPTLLEVFTDLGVAARMRTEVLDDGGLSMTVVGLFVRGLYLPMGPVRVCFETRPDAGDHLVITGVLALRPGLVRQAQRALGLPDELGRIRYAAHRRTDAPA